MDTERSVRHGDCSQKRFVRFLQARPIFLKDYDGAGNCQAGFARAVDDLGPLMPGEAILVYVTAGTSYRLYVNGRFAAHGPARTTENYLRVDAVDVSELVKAGRNIFAFEVFHCGNPYGEYSNDIARGKALLQAEIVRVRGNGGNNDNSAELIDATSPEWTAIHLSQRVRRAERISHCRQSAENYRLNAGYFAWRTAPELCRDAAAEVDCGYDYLPRYMAMPSFERASTGRVVEFGGAVVNKEKEILEDWFCRNSPDYFKVPMERPVLDYRRTEEIPAPAGMCFRADGRGGMAVTGIAPDATAFIHYDLGRLYLGFITVRVNTARPCVLDIVHRESYNFYDHKDEIAGGANPVTRLHLPAGRTEFTCFEPALVRYVKLYVRPEGSVDGGRGSGNADDIYDCTGENTPEIYIDRPEVIDYSTPDTEAGAFQCSNDDINRLYEAARRTLKLNTLDIFMDCPERERGGWLCDSLWTARAFSMFMGNTDVERAFIENFLLTPAESMWHAFFPECYPALKPNYDACPGLLTWSFWLMLELCEYVERSGDIAFARAHEDRVKAFVDGSLELTGPSGLLENLPWIFIDWSLANEYCRPISTAANALYARMLQELGKLYGRDEWVLKGRSMRSILRTVLAGSDTEPRDISGFLPDALEFRDGRLRTCGSRSEAAQYTIIWSGLFDRKEMPRYFWRLIHTTGPAREYECDTHLGKAQLFIGLCIRLDMLAKLGEYDVMLRELQAIYMPQLREGPGTLWENLDVINTSRCHGFSAHAGVLLTRDILGLGEPDEVNKTVRIDPHPCGLRWARGVVNTSDGPVSLFWRLENGELKPQLSLPEGWRAV